MFSVFDDGPGLGRTIPIDALAFNCRCNDPCPCKSGKKYKVCCKR